MDIKILNNNNFTLDSSSSSISPSRLIKDYYKNIDIKIIDTCLSDEKLNNLLELSVRSDINIFKKNRNKWKIKNKHQIIKECKTKKKKIIKDLSKSIRILSNNPNSKTLTDIKIVSKNIENNIDTIDNMLKNLYSSEEKTNSKDYDSEEYIEVYSN
jgi:hypothetical protein